MAMLLAVAVLATAGPVAAHSPATISPSGAPVGLDGLVLESPAVPPAPSELPIPVPWPPLVLAAGLGLVLALAVVRRGPRRAVVVGLVVLLTILAFEDALHSVHHGFDDKQYAECAVAAVSAHLAAVSADGAADAALILVGAGAPPHPDPFSPRIRPPGPYQDRAPPIPAV
ncbi:MAG TPA: hypothetical protein VLK28_11250 [Methylomirabilota bacterium]|nr:hypothetical protein [Methylomirabilota bacterium]